MGRIKDWQFAILFVLALIVVPYAIEEFCGKKYAKFYPNKCSRTWAVTQFKTICGSSSPERSGDGIEYSMFYDNGSQARNDFMTLARSFDGKYANGEFRHIYVSRKERIYQCYDKNKKLIALRYFRYNAGYRMGEWKSASYQIQFYIED